MQNFLKIVFEPLIRVPKTSHTTFFFAYLEIFLVIKRMLIVRLIRISRRRPLNNDSNFRNFNFFRQSRSHLTISLGFM